MIPTNDGRMIYMSTLSETLNKLQSQGIEINLQIDDAGQLRVKGYRRHFLPTEIHLIWTRRFEGQSNPGDLAILYGLKLPDGKIGVLVDGYGPASDAKITTFIRAVPLSDLNVPEP